MDVDRPQSNQAWDHDARGETDVQRLDRNWSSLLQELRVVQTGVQLLTGFMLTLPFQPRFDVLDQRMRFIYLFSVGCAVTATVLLVAPVGLHRVLFRQRRLAVLVSAAHRLAYAGLLLLGAALVGMTVIVFDAVAGHRTAYIAGGVAAVAFALFWVGLPVMIRVSHRRPW